MNDVYAMSEAGVRAELHTIYNLVRAANPKADQIVDALRGIIRQRDEALRECNRLLSSPSASTKLTRRESFAMHAMSGLLACPTKAKTLDSSANAAVALSAAEAVSAADALIRCLDRAVPPHSAVGTTGAKHEPAAADPV
jgi:hypothetical protein